MKRLIYVLFFVPLAGTSYAQRAKYVFDLSAMEWE